MQAESPLEASRMGNAPRRRATYDDLCKVPDNLVAEILDGELFASPRPASPALPLLAPHLDIRCFFV